MNCRSNFSSKKYFLTDGGLETSLIYEQGIELNHFAAFELLDSHQGLVALESYYQPYLDLAAKFRTGFVLETPTWRANPDWALKLGYSVEELTALNKKAVHLMRTIALKYGQNIRVILFSGNIGPRGDGYVADVLMTAAEAESYHHGQIRAFADAKVDLVSAITLNYAEEAMGIINAARNMRVPAVISFTVETDGRLPSGEPLGDAIERTDNITNAYASYYMINCAHPQHFMKVLQTERNWKFRIQGIRANASAKSHEELNEMTELDAGNRQDLAVSYLKLCTLLPNLSVFGGCCGTDHSHIEEIGHFCIN